MQSILVSDAASGVTDEGDEECSLDTIDDLIAELQTEVSQMNMALPLDARQRSIIATMQQLKALGPDADKNALAKIIDAAARSFSVVEAFDFPGEPLGYTLKPSYGNTLD